MENLQFKPYSRANYQRLSILTSTSGAKAIRNLLMYVSNAGSVSEELAYKILSEKVKEYIDHISTHGITFYVATGQLTEVDAIYIHSYSKKIREEFLTVKTAEA